MYYNGIYFYYITFTSSRRVWAPEYTLLVLTSSPLVFTSLRGVENAPLITPHQGNAKDPRSYICLVHLSFISMVNAYEKVVWN